MFKRRIGRDPHALGGSSGANGCPDIWELNDGSFAIIGIRKTAILKGILPESASCGDDEEIVVIPRHLLVDARSDIPHE